MYLDTCKMFISYTSNLYIYIQFMQVMCFDMKLTIIKKKEDILKHKGARDNKIKKKKRIQDTLVS